MNLFELGSGRNGTVYHLNLANKSYALKIFPKTDFRQALYETAIGAYFSCRDTKNLSKLYTANPQAGWMLMEYIDETMDRTQRPGETVFEQGFFIDDPSIENFIQGIRIDYGGEVLPIVPGKRGLTMNGGNYIDFPDDDD